jgi:hypothetical protein
MADTVTTQTLENGPRRVVMAFTNLSDGTGESGVKKVDASSSGPLGVTIAGATYYPGVHLKVVDVFYDIGSMKLQMLWEASASVQFMVLAGYGRMRFLDHRGGFQGIINPNGSGATGSILFSTVGAALNSSYTVILEMTKGVPQS